MLKALKITSQAIIAVLAVDAILAVDVTLADDAVLAATTYALQAPVIPVSTLLLLRQTP